MIFSQNYILSKGIVKNVKSIGSKVSTDHYNTKKKNNSCHNIAFVCSGRNFKEPQSDIFMCSSVSMA